MTKPKLVTLKTKALWEPIVTKCINLLISEGPRTNGMSPRAKIKVKFPKSYKFPKALPKCLSVEEDEEFITREFNAWLLLDWCYKWKLSDFSSRQIYKNRQRVLMQIAHMDRVLEGKSWTVRKESVDSELNEVYDTHINND